MLYTLCFRSIADVLFYWYEVRLFMTRLEIHATHPRPGPGPASPRDWERPDSPAQPQSWHDKSYQNHSTFQFSWDLVSVCDNAATKRCPAAAVTHCTEAEEEDWWQWCYCYTTRHLPVIWPILGKSSVSLSRVPTVTVSECDVWNEI